MTGPFPGWAGWRSWPRSSYRRCCSCRRAARRAASSAARSRSRSWAPWTTSARAACIRFVKLAGQFAAAAIPVSAGVFVDHLTLPFIDPIGLSDTAGQALTLVGIVAVMNVVNFTDGADGLAAGVCTIAAGTFAIIALSLDRDDAGVLAALTAGASVGFLWHNFHPASIFMGDAGSNLLGLLLACVAIQGVLKTAAVVALFFPLLILAVPALDATFVVAKRIKYRRPVYSADRWHFHHRFADIGFSQRRTVLYLYGWTLSLAALALAMRFVPYSDDDGTLQSGLGARDRGVRRWWRWRPASTWWSCSRS